MRPRGARDSQTDVGITDETILVGSTNAVKVLNDGYDAAQTVLLTRQLVEQDKVFAMFGAVGTKPQLAVRDYLNAQRVPRMFVSTGASTWGLDYSQHIYNLGWQPPYQGESRIYAADVAKNHSTAKIGAPSPPCR